MKSTIAYSLLSVLVAGFWVSQVAAAEQTWNEENKCIAGTTAYFSSSVTPHVLDKGQRGTRVNADGTVVDCQVDGSRMSLFWAEQDGTPAMASEIVVTQRGNILAVSTDFGNFLYEMRSGHIVPVVGLN